MINKLKEIFIQLLQNLSDHSVDISEPLRKDFKRSILFLQNKAVIEDTPQNRKKILDFVRDDIFHPYLNKLGEEKKLYATLDHLDHFYRSTINVTVNTVKPSPKSPSKSR